MQGCVSAPKQQPVACWQERVELRSKAARPVVECVEHGRRDASGAFVLPSEFVVSVSTASAPDVCVRTKTQC